MHIAPLPMASSTASLPTMSGRTSRMVNFSAARDWPGPVSTGRFSLLHFWNPPFSTAALSKPNTRSSHHTRVAHHTFAVL